jgi:hypothetical protein
VKAHPQSSIRWRKRANVARPYICLLRHFSELDFAFGLPIAFWSAECCFYSGAISLNALFANYRSSRIGLA